MKWKKSSKSLVNNCVEVARTDDGRVAVRDSKQNGRKGQAFLIFSPDEWTAFLEGAKAGEFDDVLRPAGPVVERAIDRSVLQEQMVGRVLRSPSPGVIEVAPIEAMGWPGLSSPGR